MVWLERGRQGSLSLAHALRQNGAVAVLRQKSDPIDFIISHRRNLFFPRLK
jgi:hypothetical protein